MKNLAHLFLPRHSNNYRSKILHHRIIFIFTVCLLLGSFSLVQIKRNFPQILGTSTNITVDQLISITNQKRQENGLGALKLNTSLSQAAEGKASDMFAKNYWAHISPTGTTPWVFIKDSGYNYVYAGENLAKGFTSAQDTINAWLASPTHRENELSSNYQDVGFAVETGKLNGEDTVLIVEEFGGRNYAQASNKNPTPPVTGPKAISDSKPAAPVVNAASSPVKGILTIKPLINSLTLSSGIYVSILAMFIFVLSMDMIEIGRKKVVRIAGHNMDHILFLATILLAGVIIIKGVII